MLFEKLLPANYEGGDQYFKQVSLLLHGDGTNGSQNNTFIDSSSNAFTITRTGNVAQGTFSPFSLADGQWSNYFDGNGDYLTPPDSTSYAPGTGNFAVEFWMYPTNTASTTEAPFSYGNATATGIVIRRTGTTTFEVYIRGTLVYTSSVYAFNAWSHIAVTRSGTDLRVFINGVQQGSTISNSADINPVPQGYLNKIRIGCGLTASSTAQWYFSGYVSNVRYVVGSAVYTSNFTPSTTPLTAITNTQLLTCQSNCFKDNSSNNFTITPAGDTKVTAWSPFAPSAAYDAGTNGGSGYFDGTGDYLTVGTDIVLSGDFTLEFFVYRTANEADGYTNVFSSTSPNTVQIGYNNSGAIIFYAAGWVINQIGTAVTLGAWNHVAFVRSGSTVYGYVNGVQISSGTLSSATAVTITRIGAFISGGYEVNGYLSNVRITNTVVYSSTFTPPTAPLTAVSGTQLLLNCVNAGIYDNSGKNDIETVGDAQISTSVKKYGTGSMAFDGTGDYLVTNGNTDSFAFGSGNWTIEFWLYISSLPAVNTYIYDCRPTSTQGAYPTIYITSAGNLVFFVSSLSRINASAAISTGAWQHVAICKASGSTKAFVNGTQVGSTYTDTNTYICGANRPAIASSGFTLNGNVLTGYIDDLRITKGVARYTTNFTPPAQAFPNV